MPAKRKPVLSRGAAPWQPGQSGNPKGRIKGSRNKLSQAFLAALHTDFKLHGAKVIARVREDDPAAYMRIVASLMPKDMTLDVGDTLADVLRAVDGRTRGIPALPGPSTEPAPAMQVPDEGDEEHPTRH